MPEFVRTEILPVAPRDAQRRRLTADRETLLLDFGRELHGEFVARVGTVGSTPARVRVSLGESVHEAMVGAFADRTYPVTGNAELRLGPTGFRFAWLELVGDGGLELLAPHAVAIGR